MSKIAFQGELGANSHIACVDTYPDMAVMPFASFDDAFAALRDGCSLRTAPTAASAEGPSPVW